VLVRMKPKPGDKKTNWLFIKEKDSFVDTETDILVARPESVKSGLRIDELKPDPPAEPAQQAKPKRPPKLAPAKLKGAVKAAMPTKFKPQLATPSDAPPKGTGWLHEIKFDGYRTLAFVKDGKVRLITRQGIDW